MAAGRTALIPSPGTVDPLEDHVWNEFFDDVYSDPDDSLGWDGLPPSQVNRWDYDGHTYLAPHWAGYDRQRGGSKDVSFVYDYRGDGKIYNRIDQYSHSCSLLIYVRDIYNDPVDGATIWLCSDSPYGTGIYLGCSAVTGSDGYARFAAGEDNPYYVKGVSSIGEDPVGSSVYLVVDSADAGGVYSITLNLPGSLPQLNIEHAPEPSDTTDCGIIVEWEVVGEIARGVNINTSQGLTCADLRETGRITSALFDSAQAANWEASLPSYGWLYRKRVSADTASFFFPDSGKYTFILSNEEALENDQIVELRFIGVNLINNIAETVETPDKLSVRVYPNPFNAAVSISVEANSQSPLQIEIFDIGGRTVREIEADNNSIIWDGTDDSGESLPSGIYFARISIRDRTTTARIALIR